MAKAEVGSATPPLVEEKSATVRAPKKPVAPVVVAKRFAVDLADPRPTLEGSGGKAFAAHDTREAARRVYALVHRKGVPHRADVLQSLSMNPASNVLNPIAQDVVPLGPKGTTRLVTIVEAPGGPPFSDALKGHSVSSHILRKLVIPAAIKALSALHGRDIWHRAIRPGKLFFATPEGGDVLLGECFSAPPGMDLAAAYEPLERATADPAARGPGGPEADMFALGATLLACYLGREPGGQRDSESLIRARIAQGSFWALSAGQEVPGLLGILLRGLLNDDPEERWTLDDLVAWTESASPNRRSLNLSWTFARPVSFRRQSFSDRRILAREMAKHPLEAAAWMRNLDFPLWFQTYITTENMTEKLERLLDLRADPDLSSTHHGDHALVTRLCAMLDPFGPLHWRGRSLMIDGIGPALVSAFVESDEQAIEDMLRFFDAGVMPAAIEIMSERNPMAHRMAFDLQQAAKTARSTQPAKGLVRVLYDLNPALPCLSPVFKGLWVGTPQALLLALDRLAPKRPELAKMFDAHVLAFLAARVPECERLAARVGAAPKDPVRTLAAIGDLLAFLQQHCKIARLPGLSERLGECLKPLIGRLRSRKRREEQLKTLKEEMRKGSLVRLRASTDILKLSREDADAYRRARWAWERLEARRKHLLRKVLPNDPEAMSLGYRAASILGVVTLFGVLTITLVIG